LYAGAGYGGSCFPKDVRALIHTGRESGAPLGILQAVQEANERQKSVLVRKVVRRFGEDLSGRSFAVWGLAFKPNTDDMREAPSLTVISELLRRGAGVRAFDLAATEEAARIFGPLPGLTFMASADAALEGADALLIVTEWKEFSTPDFERIRGALKQPVIVDGRNLYDPELMRAMGMTYEAVGRASGGSRGEPA
jgi:UDPglucose 6-dehydrogenase